MFGGLLVTAAVALATASSPGLVQTLVTNRILFFGLFIAELALVYVVSAKVETLSPTASAGLFLLYSALNGITLSLILLVYTGGSIAATFFATAGAFAGLSLFGYTTKKDLSGFGSFLIMGVVGLIIASLLNIWLQSPGLYWAISFLGVLIFAGLTAYDTQRLKQQYFHLRGTEFVGKAVILGALSLYLDFINMFQFLLSFMGQRD